MPKFQVMLGSGPVNGNASSRRHGAIAGLPGLRYSETSYAMTPQEEKALREAFLHIPGIDPVTAQKMGDDAVAASPHYRPAESDPRYGGSTPSSSFIQAVNVSPGLGLASITMKNGKTYSYPIDSKAAGELINSSSLGRWYNANIKLHRGGPGASTIPKSTDAKTTAQVLTNTLATPRYNAQGITPLSLGGASLGGAGLALIAQIIKAAKEAKK